MSEAWWAAPTTDLSMSIRNFPVSKKLAIAFGAVLAILVLLASVSYSNLSRLSEAVAWNDHSYKVLEAADEATLSLVNMETGLRAFAVSADDEVLAPLNSGKQRFAERFERLRSLTSDNAQQQARLKVLGEQEQAWYATVAEPMMATRRAVAAGNGSLDEFARNFKSQSGKAQMDGMRATLREFRDAEAALLTQRSDEVQHLRSVTVAVLAVGTLIAVALASMLGLWLTRAICVPLRRAVEAADGIAKGNLTARIEADSEDEPGLLLAALAAMQANLVNLMTQIRTSSDSIGTASSEVSAGNTDLSQRTEEQAASLEQTASSLAELTSTVQQSAQNASQGAQLAENAAATAQTGGEVVGQVVSTMSEISESSTRVAEIIAVIEGISFQTNILALNAAVEAARAGEQGRGFAVVATEVRTLAQRSASAAKEIKALIETSVDKVTAGTQLVDQAGDTMKEIVTSIQRVNDIMSEISAATHEQSRGIEEINRAVAQMDDVTQQNAALVEQAAAAATSLDDQARRLGLAVSAFKTH